MDGNKLKGKWVEKGMNQGEFVKTLGTTVPTMQRKEEKDAFTVSDIKKISSILGLSTDDVLDVFFDEKI